MHAYEALRQRLIAKGIYMHCISINETPSDGNYCILNYGDEIEVFQFERGIKYDLVTFKSESEAISHFEEWVSAQGHIYKY